jgi:predicted enzyme related to lactoylglutathione lyase
MRPSSGADDPAAGRIAAVRFELFVHDLERSIRFYRDAFGFTEAPRRSDDYVAVVNHGARIGLSTFAALPAGHHFCDGAAMRSGVGVEIVFEVDDLRYFAERARALGAILEPLRRRPWGLDDFRVLDPDGYYIRVTTSSLPAARG